jgi:hypothetical protein
MIYSGDTNAEDVKRMIEAECSAAAYIPLRQAIAPFLIEPYARMLEWPYSSRRSERSCWVIRTLALPFLVRRAKYPCWIIADLGSCRPGYTLAYSSYGHGSRGNPWGTILADEQSFRMDDRWFTCLEDAFINSGAWTEPLPPEYEIR